MSLNYRGNDTTRNIIVGNKLINPPGVKSDAFIRFYGDNGSFGLSKEDLSKGLMLLGQTGSGKTNVFYTMLDEISSALCDDDIIFIFDSKQDFMDRYYDPNNKNHILISANEKHKDSKSWNIFAELLNDDGKFSDESIMIAREISKLLFKNLESESQPFFHISASDLFVLLLRSYLYKAKQMNDTSNLNNKSIADFIETASNVSDYYKLLDAYPSLRKAHSYLGEGNNTQSLGVLGFLQAMVSELFVGPFRSSSNDDFSIRKLVRDKGGKIVFIEYDMLYGNALSPLYSLFFNLVIKEQLHLGKGSVCLICDEMNLLPYTDCIEICLNAGRSKGLKTMVGLQSINQLYNNYGEEEGKAIASGFVNCIAFNSSDYDTRKFASQRLGETFEAINYAGQNLNRSGFTVEDFEIHNLRIGEAFIDIANTQPFKFQFCKVL